MTEVHDIDTIHQDIPIEIFVSSSSETAETPPVPRGRGKPRMITALWRYKEDGTYDHRPNNKYHYHKDMAARNMCSYGRMAAVGDKTRHRKTRICAKLTAIRQNGSLVILRKIE